eukprot:CAMPEP_0113655382 /NCGR_PEP_ID=MMETSP0017_2-20120614/29681_1 /TAXON_ID=2856 /ORGANISM="Cylindrotheca closterium" /LENGTH=35 /DNA_ID=CAMNT_0000568635 /DNA_START=113 /DNA_END=217 /DNA_ORIENTATION=+ /assembly_acc=CAM_ASM_000147
MNDKNAGSQENEIPEEWKELINEDVIKQVGIATIE